MRREGYFTAPARARGHPCTTGRAAVTPSLPSTRPAPDLPCLPMRSVMKTFLLAAVAALFATPFPIQKALTNAVNSERAAVARYEAFAAKAEDEGYLVADVDRVQV